METRVDSSCPPDAGPDTIRLGDAEYKVSRILIRQPVGPYQRESRAVVTRVSDTLHGGADSPFLLRVLPAEDASADSQMPSCTDYREPWLKLRHKSLLPLLFHAIIASDSVPTELKVGKSRCCHVELSHPAPTMLSQFLPYKYWNGGNLVLARCVFQQLTLALLYLEEHGELKDSCCLGTDSIFVEQCSEGDEGPFTLTMCHGIWDLPAGDDYFVPEYLPPEVLRSETLEPSSCTIWRLAMIVYECVVGTPPFYDENTTAMFDKILRADLLADVQNVEKVPADLIRMLQQMIKQHPKDRLTLQQLAPLVATLEGPDSDGDALVLNAFTALCASWDTTGQLLPSDIWSRFGDYFLYSERYNAVHHGFVGILPVG